MRGATAAVYITLGACISSSNAWTSNSVGRRRSSALFLSSDGGSSPRDTAAKNLAAASTRRKKNGGKRRTSKLNMASSSNMAIKKKKKDRTLSPVAVQRWELGDHEILTRQEELDLGTKVVRANKLREAMAVVIEDKKASLQQEIAREVYGSDVLENIIDFDELSHFSMIQTEEEEALFDPDGLPFLSGEETHLHNHYQNQVERRGPAVVDDLDDRLLTDDNIVQDLELSGGRAELRRILLEGAFARDTLIRNNIRLVVSIAKRWARQSAKYNNQDGARLVSIYNGSSNRASLDEAIQEGILGLARAADGYDPSRGLKFSTYSTYWVTNFVRRCFQDATTGSLYVPQQLHDIKRRHKTLLKSYYDAKRQIPSEEEIAGELGVTVARLKSALRSTQALLSLDGPLVTGPSKGSNAGGDSVGASELLISDTLQCTEPPPEDHVELSFLRNCLENAMAAELSPHERDILRLRLGLDDGVTRSVREVVAVCGGTVSASEVRSAEQRAYKKLRAPYSLQNYKLSAFLDHPMVGIDRATVKVH